MIPENEPAHVANRIVRAVSQCRTGGQLEFVRRYALLASRRYKVDLMPLLAAAEIKRGNNEL